MELVNYIINLPEKIVETVEVRGEEKPVSLEGSFMKEMEQFFKSIEDEEKVNKMRLFKKGKP